MQSRISHAFGDNTKSQSMNVSDTMRKDISNPIFFNKRKLVSGIDSLGQPQISEMAKRAHKTSTRYLDLNLLAEENEVRDGKGIFSQDINFDGATASLSLSLLCLSVSPLCSFNLVNSDLISF